MHASGGAKLRGHVGAADRRAFAAGISQIYRVAITAVLAAVLVGGPARAETLLEALSAAYKFNPRLDAARATLRATDEEVPRALAGYKPSVTGSADSSFRHITTNPGTTANGDSNPRGYQIGMVQPLFRGFRTVNAVNAAEATVRAGRESCWKRACFWRR